jgi:predicted ATP-dependent endonuclease of OLD family
MHNLPDTRSKSIKIRELKITNFKGLDEIELSFPAPKFKGDLDIIVMGSRNGIGKTSVLECCVLLFFAACTSYSERGILENIPIDILDLLIRSGEETAKIEGMFVVSNQEYPSILTISRNGICTINSNPILKELVNNPKFKIFYNRDNFEKFFYSLAGLSQDPTILPHLIYFHSYRKIEEGNPELGMMIEDKSYKKNRYGMIVKSSTSTFKLQILRSLMSQGGLFENLDDTEADNALEILNKLMKQYTSGTIQKLRPLTDNTIEFRVTPTNGQASFPFDGLSSGQKEIISTLFLIWKYTAHSPGIVLIDEPELHLNPEWHRLFIRQLYQLAPKNQYIIATHSEDIFASVDSDRRILLSSSGDVSNVY